MPAASFVASADPATAAYVTSWLRTHDSEQDRFSAVLRLFFDGVAERLAGEVRINPATAFLPSDFTDQFAGVLGQGLGNAAATGVRRELDHVRKVSDNSPLFASIRDNNPAIADDIAHWIGGIVSQPWVQGMADDMKNDLAAVLAAGVERGDSNKFIADDVQRVLGETGRTRANRIAATEIGGALNHGHDSARIVLQAETGVTLRKEWIAVLDKDTRPEHVQANGQTVNVGDSFTLSNGERCEYPGARNLSAGQRIHCRCTSATAGILEAIAG